MQGGSGLAGASLQPVQAVVPSGVSFEPDTQTGPLAAPSGCSENRVPSV
jgi:hypothetical protein